MKPGTVFFTTLLCSIAASPLYAQPNAPQGFPFTQAYRRGDFVGSPQTWSMLRATDGLLYFGNTRYGIQESDGLTWRNLRMERNSAALSLAEGQNGDLFAGGQFDFGVLRRDSLLRRRYHSLIHLLPDSAPPVKDVAFTFVQGDTVHFISAEVWYRYHNNRIMLHQNSPPVFSAAEHNRTIVSLHAGRTLQFTSAGAIQRYQLPLSLEKPQFLTTGNDRLFLWDNAGVLWEIHADGTVVPLVSLASFFAKNPVQVNAVCWTNSGYLLLATSNGLYVFSQEGRHLFSMYEQDGLSSNALTGMTEDANGNVWISSLHGITALELGRGMRQFLPTQGLPDQLAAAQEFRGTLYVGSRSGLHMWEKDRFRPVLDDRRVYTLVLVPQGMLVGSTQGLHLLDEKGVFHPLYTRGPVDLLLPDREKATTVYFTHFQHSLRRLDLETSKRFTETELAAHTVKSYTLTEDVRGDLWIGTGANGDFQFITEQQNGIVVSIREIRTFTTANGLPSNGFNYTMQVGGDVGFITSNGFYRLTGTRDSIVIDRRFERIFEMKDRSVWPVTQDKNGGIWLAWAAAYIGKAVSNPTTGQFDWKTGEFTRIAPYRDVDFILPTGKNRVYFLTNTQKLAYFDSSLTTGPFPGFRAHINAVVLNKDSVLWEPRGLHATELRFPIGFHHQKIRFHYGMIAFLPEDRLYYSIKLEGLDKEWSDWTSERYRDYTNLAEGRYRFRVRGSTLYPGEAEEASLSFVVLPPWYRTVWAHALYLLGGIGMLAGLVRFRERQLMRRQEQLEAEISHRTEEIRLQKEQLEEMDKVKSRFFANVGHEFRTPLTIIKGLLERTVATEPLPQTALEKVLPVLRNVDRLSVMVEQVMSLSSVDNRVMAVRNEPLRADQIVTLCVESFRSLADLKEQTLQFEPSAPGVVVETDRNKMETVVNNLLSNAIKYNRKMGTVTVRTARRDDGYEVTVDDTGPGIDPEHREAVFERFHRIKQQDGKYVEGLGIGLDLSRAYARTLGGDVFVDGSYTNGARFVFRLPVAVNAAPPLELETVVRQPRTGMSKAATGPGDKKPRVLLVEDNPDIGLYVSDILRSEVYSERVENGREALQWLENNRCDLIVTDLMMPEMDGEALVNHLAADARFSNIPVVVLTAKSTPEIRLRLLRYGVVDFINKPFNADELLIKIINLLGYVKNREKFQALVAEENPVMLTERLTGKIAAFIVRNLQDAGLSADRIAEQFTMSRRTLYRVIQAETGLTYAAFVKEVRLQEAYTITLAHPEITLKDLAARTGYLDASNFKKLFVERFGHAPGAV